MNVIGTIIQFPSISTNHCYIVTHQHQFKMSIFCYPCHTIQMHDSIENSIRGRIIVAYGVCGIESLRLPSLHYFYFSVAGRLFVCACIYLYNFMVGQYTNSKRNQTKKKINWTIGANERNDEPEQTGDDYCGKGHACHINATCLNLNTKYSCTCRPGFQGNGFDCTGQCIYSAYTFWPLVASVELYLLGP